jgi:hypothetical protein
MWAGEPGVGSNTLRMGLQRLRRDLKELRRVFSDLTAAPGPEEEAAGYRLVASAHRFSRNTKAVVDDKLSFTATLMRAGEVEAANRLVAEVEQEVVAEEAALFETVNEVKVAQAIRKERMTRMRMARLLATALLGSSVLASSAVAAAFTGMLDDRAAAEKTARAALAQRASGEGTTTRGHAREQRGKRERRVRIAGVRVGLSPAEIRTYQLLTADGSHEAGLEFLSKILPDEIVQKVRSAISTASQAVSAPAVDEVKLVPVVETPKKKAAKAKAKANSETEAKQESSSGDSSSPKNGDSSNQGGDKKNKNEEEEGDSGGLPLPGDDDN